MRVIVSGGAGFIGSALVRHLVLDKGYEVLNIDALTYAGNLASLRAVEGHAGYAFLKADIRDRAAMEAAVTGFRPDRIMHLAAESHVDRSITGAADFISTNVVGTFTLLEAARGYWDGLAGAAKDAFRFLHVSTDEVYGSLGADGLFEAGSKGKGAGKKGGQGKRSPGGSGAPDRRDPVRRGGAGRADGGGGGGQSWGWLEPTAWRGRGSRWRRPKPRASRPRTGRRAVPPTPAADHLPTTSLPGRRPPPGPAPAFVCECLAEPCRATKGPDRLAVEDFDRLAGDEAVRLVEWLHEKAGGGCGGGGGGACGRGRQGGVGAGKAWARGRG